MQAHHAAEPLQKWLEIVEFYSPLDAQLTTSPFIFPKATISSQFHPQWQIAQPLKSIFKRSYEISGLGSYGDSEERRTLRFEA